MRGSIRGTKTQRNTVSVIQILWLIRDHVKTCYTAVQSKVVTSWVSIYSDDQVWEKTHSVIFLLTRKSSYLTWNIQCICFSSWWVLTSRPHLPRFFFIYLGGVYSSSCIITAPLRFHIGSISSKPTYVDRLESQINQRPYRCIYSNSQ